MQLAAGLECLIALGCLGLMAMIAACPAKLWRGFGVRERAQQTASRANRRRFMTAFLGAMTAIVCLGSACAIQVMRHGPRWLIPTPVAVHFACSDSLASKPGISEFEREVLARIEGERLSIPERWLLVAQAVNAVHSHAKPEGRSCAVRILGALGAVNPRVAPSLRDALADSDPEVRIAAAQAIGEIGGLDDQSTTSLLGALHDDDPKVRIAVIVSLGSYGADADRTLPALLQIAMDTGENPEVRAAATGWAAWYSPVPLEERGRIVALALDESSAVASEALRLLSSGRVKADDSPQLDVALRRAFDELQGEDGQPLGFLSWLSKRYWRPWMTDFWRARTRSGLANHYEMFDLGEAGTNARELLPSIETIVRESTERSAAMQAAALFARLRVSGLAATCAEAQQVLLADPSVKGNVRREIEMFYCMCEPDWETEQEVLERINSDDEGTSYLLYGSEYLSRVPTDRIIRYVQQLRDTTDNAEVREAAEAYLRRAATCETLMFWTPDAPIWLAGDAATPRH